MRAAGLCCCLLACAKPPAVETRPPAANAPGGLESFERIQIGGVLRGISGLARRDDGRLLVVPERERVAFFLDLGARTLDPPTGLVIEGVPEGLDLESAAFDLEQVVLGTEGKEERGQDLLLFAKLSADKLSVTKSLPLPYTNFGGVAEGNHGLEGLCAVPGEVLAISETIVERGPTRTTPLFIVQTGTDQVSTHQVKLLTERGKLSGLACRRVEQGVEVIGVERHFETSRLIYFRLPKAGGPALIEPSELFDVARLFEGDPPNFEGVEILGDRRLLLISDNDYGGVKGPTELLLLTLSPDPAGGGFRTGGSP